MTILVCWVFVNLACFIAGLALGVAYTSWRYRR